MSISEQATYVNPDSLARTLHMRSHEPDAVWDGMQQVVNSMYVEFSVCAVFLFGYLLVNMLKPLKHNKQSTASTPFIQIIKTIRSDYPQGNFANILSTWRKLVAGGWTECCPLDVLRMVLHCLLDQCEDEIDQVKELAHYVASFPDAYRSMPVDPDAPPPKRKKLPVDGAESRSMILTRMMQVTLTKSTKPVGEVFNALQSVLQCVPEEETYDVLITAYMNSQDAEKVDETLRKIREQYSVVSPRAYGLVAMGFLKAQNLDKALHYLQEMRDVGCLLSNSIVVELFRSASTAGRLDEALALALELSTKGCANLNAESIYIMMEDGLKRRDVDACDKAASLAKELGVTMLYGTYDCLIKVHILAGTKEAFMLYNEMREQYALSCASCVSMISVCAESKFSKFAQMVFEERRVLGQATLQMYSALMKVYAGVKRFEAVCDLYPLMVEDGIIPDASMRGCLMNYASKAKRQDLADELYRDSTRDMAADEMYYISILRTCRQDRDVGRAIKLKSEMVEKGLMDKAAWLTLLDVCAVSGDLSATLEVFDEMVSEGAADEVAYNRLVKGYCNANQVGNAKKTIQRMEADGFTATSVTYNFLVTKHCNDCEYSAAWGIIHAMKAKQIEEDWFTVLALAKAMKNCRDEHFVRNVLELLDTTKVDMLRDDIYFNTVLDSVMRTKDTRRLIALIKKTVKSKFVPSVATMNMMIKAFSSLRRIDEAIALWKEMTEVRAVEPNMISLGCIADALVVNDRLEEAVKVVDAWKGRVPLNTIIYSTLIKGYAIRKNAGGALQVLDQMTKEGHAPNLVTINTVIDACCRGGELEKCMGVFNKMPSMGMDADRITYSTMVKGFARDGDMEGAASLLAKMEAVGFRADYSIYNVLIEAAASRACYHLADSMFDQMLRGGVAPSSYTLMILIKRYGREGNLQKAQDLLTELPGKYGFKASTNVYTAMISACVQNSQLAKACHLVEKMKCEGPAPDNATYEKIVNGCLRVGQTDNACKFFMDAYGLNGPPGLATRAGALDTTILERLVEQLNQRGFADSHAIPLVQKLRAANVPMPQGLVSATLRGAVGPAVGTPKAESAKITAAPWRKRA